MKIVIGEVLEKNGNYKMARAVHLEIPDDCLDIEPYQFAKQFLVGPARQLIAWRTEALEHVTHIVEAVKH